jgi:hypothetical protein
MPDDVLKAVVLDQRLFELIPFTSADGAVCVR